MKKNILGVDITDASEKEILEYVFNFLEKSSQKLSIVTPNPEMVVYSREHKEVREILNHADIALCDGVGLFKAAAFLGNPLPERIPGTDFMEKLCKESVRKHVTVGFLGGQHGVAERASDCLQKKYQGLKVAFVGEEWLDKYKGKSIMYKGDSDATLDTSYLPHDTKIDILFVAFGFPKQEEWMAKHLEKIPVRVMMGVGGAFDYISGDIGRAPKLMRNSGLEWLYRLIRQPWRFKRQLALPRFAILVLKERFRKSS